MVPLSVPRAARRVTIPAPAFGQFVGRGIHVQRHHLVAGIDAASQEDAGLATVKTGRTEEVLRRAVAVAVAPCCVQVGLAVLQSLQGVFHHLIGFTCLTVHIYQVFVALVHEPLSGAGGSQIVLCLVADDVFRTVGHVNHRTIRGAHHGFGSSVLIPVVGHDILFVILEIGHVRTQIDPPQLLAVHLEYLDDEVFSVVASLLVVCTSPALIVELHQNLQFAVAVHIGTACVIGNIGRRQRPVVGRNLQPFLRPDAGFLAGILL